MKQNLEHQPSESNKISEKGARVSRYIYRNHSGKEDKIVFECTAENILEADKLYQKATGNNPEKQSYVGCEIIPVDSSDDKVGTSQ